MALVAHCEAFYKMTSVLWCFSQLVFWLKSQFLCVFFLKMKNDTVMKEIHKKHNQASQTIIINSLKTVFRHIYHSLELFIYMSGSSERFLYFC